MAQVTEVFQDGDWRIIYVYTRLKVLHRCPESRFSWEWNTHDEAWAPVADVIGRDFHELVGCRACDTVPPMEIQGFLNLLNWER